MCDNSNNDDGILAECADDKQAKRALLIDTIKEKCASSPHTILQKIHCATSVSGSVGKLEATILSGGYTNYSYKVAVDKHPELCVFAKLCFEYALWNPDKTAHYDLQRTANEYEVMKSISTKTPDCVVCPLACWDVEHGGQKMKLLVTEWSRADEQFSNQFIDGAVDARIATKIANTLATLHNIKGFDPDFNLLVKPCMENLQEHMKEVAKEASKAQNPKDRTESYSAGLGEEAMMKIMNSVVANYHKRDCLIHSDAHVFNILVEGKPSIEELEKFGPNGMMVLCDWEMAMAGPIGRDIGLVLSFPLGCMIAHALNGHSEANESIENFIDALIETYSSRMIESGKTSEEMAGIIRNIVGWCGWFQYLAFYILDVQNFWPVESDQGKSRLRDSLGVLGLKLLRLSFDHEHVPASTSSESISRMFKSMWEDEATRAQNVFAAGRQRMQPRKSSILRVANRRLSDTEMLYLAAENVKRLSISEDNESVKSPVIAEDDKDVKILQ